VAFAADDYSAATAKRRSGKGCERSTAAPAVELLQLGHSQGEKIGKICGALESRSGVLPGGTAGIVGLKWFAP
jgi:hypothetical protein